jgi:hypothetical protein
MRRSRAARALSRASRLFATPTESDARDQCEPLAAQESAPPLAEEPPLVVAASADTVAPEVREPAPVATAPAAAPDATAPVVPASSALGAIAFVHSEHDLSQRRSQLLRKARVAFVSGHGVPLELWQEASGLAHATRVALGEGPTLIVAPAGWSPSTPPNGAVVDGNEFVRIVDAYRQMHVSPGATQWLRQAVDRARVAVRRERVERAAPAPNEASRQPARAVSEPAIAELEVVANRLQHYLTLKREGR